MKELRQILVFTILLILAAGAIVFAANNQEKQEAINSLLTTYPGTQFYIDGSSVTRIYGRTFGSGSTPQGAAESFRRAYAPVLGVAVDELRAESRVITDGNIQPVMYLEESGTYKFMLVYYNQYKNNIPVFNSELRILVKNEPGYPIVLAVSSLKDLGNFQAGQAQAAVDPQTIQRAFLSVNPQYTRYTDAHRVIWAGDDKLKVEPTVAVEFVADDGNTPTTNKFRFIIDATTGEILYQKDLVIDINVTGQVNGNATENFKSEQCGNEVSTHMPYARVYINSGSPFYADSLGNYTITNSGSTPVTVTSYIRGRFFQVFNQAGAESYLTQTVTPPGPANFLHNPANGEYNRAEVNGYLHANIVRDYALRFNPTYPSVYSEYDYPVYVNDNTGYCPGNAWYDGYSITFCRASSPYPNTAFSTVIHHEYGHHLVDMAGSGQDEYGEGMGDVMGVLITDDPGVGWGFFGSCSEALRNANNSIQYPCVGEIHDCGQLISGCVWSTRNALQASYPATYRSILSNLAINSMLLHTGGTIAPDITIDYLTLDDDDGDLENGTPHYNEICTGFNAHNMDCPLLNLLAFTYPNGRPDFINPSGGTTMRVNVTAVAGNPQQNSGVLHYNSGSGWLTVNMIEVNPNEYDAVFPSILCGTTVHYYVSARTTSNTTVNDPADAPTSYYIVMSAAELVTIYSDNFATNQGWTGTGGSGEWTIGVANGGSGGDSHGYPDPANDHSSTTDDRLLGNDLTSGSGGDYAADLATTYYVTSPTINCTGQTNISLSFWRWLGVEQNLYDNANLQVYNGTSWATLFASGSTTIDESAWSQYSYDVSTYANNNANFKIRFGIGPTDSGWEFCGWNIDDLTVTAISCASSNGNIAGTVTDSHGNVANCIVHAFDSSNHNAYDTTLASGAYSVSVPAGTYSLTLTQIDHSDTTLTSIPVTVGNTTTRNVVMRRLLGSIRGTVTSGPSQPISGVRIVPVGSGKADTTGADGVYLITGLTDGTFSILFDATGYRDSTINNVNITPGDTATLNIVLTAIQGGCSYVVGDANASGTANGIDVTYMVNYLKGVGSEPPDICDCAGHGFVYVAADANGSCDFNGIDVTYMVNYFKGGAQELTSCADCPPILAKERNKAQETIEYK